MTKKIVSKAKTTSIENQTASRYSIDESIHSISHSKFRDRVVQAKTKFCSILFISISQIDVMKNNFEQKNRRLHCHVCLYISIDSRNMRSMIALSKFDFIFTTSFVFALYVFE